MEQEIVVGGMKVLTPRDIQEIFKIGKNSAYVLMHSPSFPSFSINSRLYVTEASLLEWTKTYEGRNFKI